MDFSKVTIKQLSHILNVSYNTAQKDYKKLVQSLELKRDFLVLNDLKTLKIIK